MKDWQIRCARVAELRTRCVTELAEFERVTQHIDEPSLTMTLRQRRIGLLAKRRSIPYRVKMRGLKMRIVAVHNSVRKCGYAGVGVPVWKIAERLGVSTSQYRACMRELQEAGVFTVAPYSIAQRIVNRHDLRAGRTPRCYSRSRRANVVTFGTVGLRLIGVQDRTESEDNLCRLPPRTTLSFPEGNGLENFESQKKSCGVEQSSTGDPSPDGDSISPIAWENVAAARTRTCFRAWLAKKEA